MKIVIEFPKEVWERYVNLARDGEVLSYWGNLIANGTPLPDRKEEWCEGCKEYDKKNHCCHRYSSFIRQSLNENINAVLEDIKTEILKASWDNYYMPVKLFTCDDIFEIIDKHIRKE